MELSRLKFRRLTPYVKRDSRETQSPILLRSLAGSTGERWRNICGDSACKSLRNRVLIWKKAVKQISLSSDNAVNDRVRKKMREYLTNISEVIDTSQPWEVVKASLKPKTKNLPQRYHTCLVQVAEAYFKNLWKVDKQT